jgi:hypothetical protein
MVDRMGTPKSYRLLEKDLWFVDVTHSMTPNVSNPSLLSFTPKKIDSFPESMVSAAQIAL